jgi:hypothetical protein
MSTHNQRTPAEQEAATRIYLQGVQDRKTAERAKEAQNLQLAESVALLLGSAVQAPRSDEQYCTGFTIKLDAGGCINLIFDSWGKKGRILISGDYPRDTRTKAPSITIAETKTPEQIAKDIKRRFLPVYKETYSDALAAQAARDDYQSKLAAVRADVLSIKGISSAGKGDKMYIAALPLHGEITYISTTAGCTVNLRDVPVSVLRAILEMVQSKGELQP